MKKIIVLTLAIVLLLSANSFACVGRTLIIGSLNSSNDKLLTQLMAVIVTERTGTTVEVKYYDNHAQLFEAIKKKEVNILPENTGRALKLMGMKAGEDADSVYSVVKKGYKDMFQLIMLKPFGASVVNPDDKLFVDVPTVDSSVLVNFPVLPRVLNKLAGIAADKKYPKLLASVEAGDEASKVAKDFLKKKRMI